MEKKKELAEAAAQEKEAAGEAEKEEEDGKESTWRDGGDVGGGTKLDLSQEVDSSDAESDTTCGSDDVIDESYFATTASEQQPEPEAAEVDVQPSSQSQSAFLFSFIAPGQCYTVEI